MTTNFTLRLPRQLTDRIDQVRGQKSRTAWILDTLADQFDEFDPVLILGYIELAGGELGPDATCPGCNQEFGDRGIFIGITAGLRWFGPVCGLCASSE